MDCSATTYPDSFDRITYHPRRLITSLADQVFSAIRALAVGGDM
jgi:hypothetical protein